MAAYTWKPIRAISDKDKTIDLAASLSVYGTWRTSQDRLQKSSPTQLKNFNERLIRRLSVETGILQGLYDLDRGTTETLVANGFIEDPITRSARYFRLVCEMA